MSFNKIICILFFALVYHVNIAFAQKKVIDSNAYANWCSVGNANISSNGKYVYHIIENEPIGNHTVTIQSTEKKWKKNFIGYSVPQFLCSNGRGYAILLNPSDSLMIVSLGRDLVKFIPNVNSFRIYNKRGNDWIAYQLKQLNKEFVVQNLKTGKKHNFIGVVHYMFSNHGQDIILQNERKVGNALLQTINWINLNTGKSILVWEGKNARNLVLDKKDKQLAFISEGIIYQYNKTFDKLAALVNPQFAKIDSGLRIGGIRRFSNDGQRLFIDLLEETKLKPISSAVEVWSYVDHKLQSQQEQELSPRAYMTVVEIASRRIIRLERKWENLAYNIAEGTADTIGVIVRQESDGRSGEGHWNIACEDSTYLISLKDGKRTKMDYYATLSPSGKFAVYFDPKKDCYISYNVETGRFSNITKGVTESFRSDNWEREYELPIAGWSSDDKVVFLYDKYDLWSLDPLGQKSPINLTNGFGRRTKIVFSIICENSFSKIVRKTDSLILSAFAPLTKQNGFYKILFGKSNNPRYLSMGDFIYDVKNNRIPGFPPIKAQKANIYLVNRMSATLSSNYFVTKDFIKFKPISDLHPEKKYNWYTTELHKWKSLDGRTLQGVLYKPENFDARKKYPVIFYYYERKSDGLNAYLAPGLLGEGSGTINIPTYVSNGYLIFSPDIYYMIGDPMKGTYDAVTSAANYVSSLPFVNAKKLGIHGNSFGGIQTNYLVTHSNLFAAACSSSGMSDWISYSGRIGGSGSSLKGFVETGQLRMGASLWEKPESYVKNSPIFYLNKVETPLLIMHTKNDAICSYDDAIEFFTGLRRLGKKSWMLAYSKGNHALWGNEAKDFSIRMMQFFDHYLKDKPVPLWMLDGIPASRRGLDDGLALDTAGRVPGPGLLIPEEQRKVDSLLTRKPITITIQ